MKSNGVVAALWWRISLFSSLFSGMHKLPMEEKEYDEIRLGKDDSEPLFLSETEIKRIVMLSNLSFTTAAERRRKILFPS